MSKDDDILTDEVREYRGVTPNAWPDDPENTATALKERRYLSEPIPDGEAKRRMSAMSRRNFLIGGAAGLLGIFGWRWMSDEAKYNLLRSTFEFNEKVSSFFFRPSRLAPEFPPSAVTAARVNGGEGLSEGFDPAAWRLGVRGIPGSNEDLQLTLADLKQLPRTEMITELKCIEGWSIVVHWAGVRFSDFAARYSGFARLDDLPKYVSLVTPDAGYFVGWDTPSILHPQTLLAYEMNGESLKPEHGAPLRLASPTKYGIKLIKRIGLIEFTNERPRDFWAEQGYDWYSGH
jgi:DMSO/TMAO reductase YedYZ molybdopterin-dependent catalytic subunit